MKNKIILLCFVAGLLSIHKFYSQNETLKNVAYITIAEGTDSPFADLQIVCFNKFFNKDYMTTDFRKKYNLDEKTLYQNKMLIEVFHSDTTQKGIDKIELVSIKENNEKLIIEYNLVNANKDNDAEALSPFLIVQVAKSKKETIFIVNGIALGKASGLYVD